MTNFTEFYTSLAEMWPVTRSGSDIASHPDKSIQKPLVGAFYGHCKTS